MASDISKKVEGLLGEDLLNGSSVKTFWNVMTGGCQTELTIPWIYVLGQGREGKIRSIALVAENRLARGNADMANATTRGGSGEAYASFAGYQEKDYQASAGRIWTGGRRVIGIQDIFEEMGAGNVPATEWKLAIESYVVKDAGAHSGNAGGTLTLLGLRVGDDGKVLSFITPFENRQYTHPEYDRDDEPSEAESNFFRDSLKRFRVAGNIREKAFEPYFLKMVDLYKGLRAKSDVAL